MPTYTYAEDPANEPVDAVRFLVGDTQGDEWFLSDEEIRWIIDVWVSKNSVFYTASMAAEAIAAKFAREVSTNADGQTVNTSELQQKYLDLAARLRRQHETLLTGGFVDVGGINPGEQPDPTVTPPAFGTGMHDFSEAGQQDMGDYGPRSYPWQWGDYGY
jgi:hypothetical protein